MITSLGISRVDTVRGNEIWLSAVRPIGLQYRLGPVEASADVIYYSDVAKYKSAAMPENLSIGMNLAMNFGDRPNRR